MSVNGTIPAVRTVTDAPAPVQAAALQEHFTPQQLAARWQISPDTVRKLFEAEPGVLVIETRLAASKRRYRTLRIPESVAARVHRRLTHV